LERRGIAYTALDNSFLSCAEPEKLQQICDWLDPGDSDRVFRKWLKRIPLPMLAQDREAGYDWALSIRQMEVSLTQVFDRPLRGWEFFEQVIRDNLDLGRPDRVQPIFDRVVTKKTPREFRARVIHKGVHPLGPASCKPASPVASSSGRRRVARCRREPGSPAPGRSSPTPGAAGRTRRPPSTGRASRTACAPAPHCGAVEPHGLGFAVQPWSMPVTVVHIDNDVTTLAKRF
jgi:hypothetical protein